MDKQNISKRLERDHPVLSEDSPLNKHICRAANAPDVKSLLVMLAHPMQEEDIKTLAKNAGNHKAHHNRVRHLREHAIKKHGSIGSLAGMGDEDEEGDGSYPSRKSRQKDLTQLVESALEDGGLGKYNYGPTSQKKKLSKGTEAITGGEAGLGFASGRTTPTTPMGGTSYTQDPGPTTTEHPGTQTTTKRGITERNALGSQAFSRGTRGRGGQNMYVDAAGQAQVGRQTWEPFGARLQFDHSNQHEANVHSFLQNNSKRLTGKTMAPEDMGNHILFQDLKPDPNDHTYGLGMDRKSEDRKRVAQWMVKSGKAKTTEEAHNQLDIHNSRERRDMADQIAEQHPGTTTDDAMNVLNKLHRQAELQFNAHPMHDMSHVMMGKEIRTPQYDAQGNQLEDHVERTQEHAVPRDEKVNPVYDKGNKPLSYTHFGRIARLWNDIPTDVRDKTRKWYDSEADNFIKDLSYAGRTHYLKSAGVLAQLNNSMGWDTGASGAVQWILNNMERNKAGDKKPLIPKNAYGARYLTNGPHNESYHDENGNIKYREATHEAGDDKIIKPVSAENQNALREIMDAPEHDENGKYVGGKSILPVIRKHLATQKLGNFFMDMVGAAPWHTNTQDVHQLGASGHIAGDGAGFAKAPRDPEDYRYFWRNMHAVSDMLGVPAREIQAATWVKWRRDKGETTQGAANPDWPKARAALDEAMRKRAQEDGDPHFIGRVEGWIAHRQKREREFEKIQPTTAAEHAGRERVEKDLVNTMKDNALDKMWKQQIEPAVPGGAPLAVQTQKQTPKEKKAGVAPTVTGIKTTKPGGPRKTALSSMGTALGKISPERKQKLKDAADKIPGLRELLGLDETLGKSNSFYYHNLLQKALDEVEWLNNYDRWDDDEEEEDKSLTFVIVRR